MKHLSRLLDLQPRSTKAQVLKHLKRGPEDHDAPITISLPSDGDTSYKMVVEFDRHGLMAFGELTASIKGEDKALAAFHRLSAEMHRTEVIKRTSKILAPIRRTTLPMTHLLAWSTWPLDEDRRLQLLVGIFHSAQAQTHRTLLAASVHVDADQPDYGPRLQDISSAQAKGWDDYLRSARSDIHGGVATIRDVTDALPVRGEPEPYGPGSVFRIFP